MLFLPMFVKIYFQLCFVLTLITVYVVNVVVDFIMFLQIFFSSSGVVTGGTPQNWAFLLNFFFFMVFVFFMNRLHVFEVAILAIETLMTELTHPDTFSQFVILHIADKLGTKITTFGFGTMDDS